MYNTPMEQVKINHVLIVHKLPTGEKEKETLAVLRSFLKKKSILSRVISPLEVHPGMVQGRNLIIILGGDGTFLKVAQHVLDTTPFLCVNTNLQQTEGFFSKTSMSTLEKKLGQILQGRLRTICIARLSATINGKAIEPCINEYFIGQKKPYDVSYYELQVKGKKEQQKSSGILVSTPAGSTAWTRGAGGKVLQLHHKQFQFVVREPYMGRLTKTQVHQGILKQREKLLIVPKGEGMILIADAVGREYALKKNDRIEIAMSVHPLCLYY